MHSDTLPRRKLPRRIDGQHTGALLDMGHVPTLDIQMTKLLYQALYLYYSLADVQRFQGGV